MADSTPSTAGAAATGGASSTAGRLGSSGQDRGTAAVGSTNRGDGKVETRVASTARDAAGAGDAGGQGKGSKPKRARKKGTRELKNERKWAAIMEKLHRPPFKPVKMALIADNRFVIWSAEGAARLRTRCRIVLVPGGFAEPKASWWSMVAVDTTRLCSVPLILGDEEASLCMERGWVELVDAPGDVRRTMIDTPPKFAVPAEATEKWQQFKELQKRKREAAAAAAGGAGAAADDAPAIGDGHSHNRAAGDGNDRPTDGPPPAKLPRIEGSASEPAKADFNTADGSADVADGGDKPAESVVLRDGCPFLEAVAKRNASLDPRPPRTPAQNRSYSVFVDLWRLGYYVSCGSKFGATFLAYARDPTQCHASFLVNIASSLSPVVPLDFVMRGRIGSIARKQAVLAVVNPSAAAAARGEDDGKGTVEYVRFTWDGRMDTMVVAPEERDQNEEAKALAAAETQEAKEAAAAAKAAAARAAARSKATPKVHRS